MVVRPSSSAVRGQGNAGIPHDGDGAAGIVGERRGELVADSSAALGPRATLVDDQSVLRVRRRGGGGVARVERLRERRDQRGDGLLVLARRLAGAAAGRACSGLRPRPGLCAPRGTAQQRRADHQIDRFHARSFPSGIDSLAVPEFDPQLASRSGKDLNSGVRELGFNVPAWARTGTMDDSRGVVPDLADQGCPGAGGGGGTTPCFGSYCICEKYAENALGFC